MEANAARATVEPLSRSTVLGLVAMGVAVLIIANDFTALSVALPAIEQDLDADAHARSQWVINGYALVFGVLIVTGGRLADMFGRRRGFFVGAAIFAGVLGARRRRAERRVAPRLPRPHGHRRRAHVARDPRHDLRACCPRSRQGSPAASSSAPPGFGNAVGPLLGGCAHRRAELALDLLPEPADRGRSRARDAGGSSRPTRPRPSTTRLDYARRRDAVGRSRRAAGRPRPGHRRGAGPTRGSSRLVRDLRGDARRRSALVERRAGDAALVPPDVHGQPRASRGAASPCS